MRLILAITAISFSLGCADPKPMASSNVRAITSVQLFNEAVLGSSPTDAVIYRGWRSGRGGGFDVWYSKHTNATWTPKQVILDYKDNACYGAMVHYDRSNSFYQLRAAINSRFASYENPTFAASPTMGIWRIEDLGFSIQLSINNDEDTYTVIYILFVNLKTIASKLEELHEKEPQLFHEQTVDDFIDSLKKTESSDTSAPNGH
jgi:hypothetical protein